MMLKSLFRQLRAVLTLRGMWPKPAAPKVVIHDEPISIYGMLTDPGLIGQYRALQSRYRKAVAQKQRRSDIVDELVRCNAEIMRRSLKRGVGR